MVNNISIGVGYPWGALHVLKGTAFELSPYAVLCTRVYTVVYPRVHCCIHACTQRCSLLLRLGALFCSMDGLLVYSANGLSSARQKGSCQLGGWTPLSAMNGLVPALWIAFSLRRGGLLS